jgi:hypothetical protein
VTDRLAVERRRFLLYVRLRREQWTHEFALGEIDLRHPLPREGKHGKPVRKRRTAALVAETR